MKHQKENLVEREKQREDLGFGSKAVNKQARLVKSDGKFNVKKLGQSLNARLNIYHRLIMMSWTKLFFVLVIFYFLTNLFFGSIYYFIGVKNLAGIVPSDNLSDFWEAFFFSSQTLTTVGYGRISPTGYLTNFIAATESLIGLMTFAIMTGLLYGRFSKPSPRILYSENAIMAPYLNTTGLMFRLVNEKSNQLINVKASVIFSRNELSDGELKRRYYQLELERKEVKFFAMSWTLVHPITETSVLVGETAESLRNSDAEFLVSIEALDDTQADPVHSRKSYWHNEIVWEAQFQTMLHDHQDKYLLDLTKLNDFSKIN
jgi:inward rectifier potassium channel